MFGTYFYHQRVRKAVAIFGTLFNNIYVIRADKAGKVISTVKVPLSYGPSRKFLDRIRENPTLDNDTKVAIKLPRMSFEVISIQYDAGRQLQKSQAFLQAGSASTSRNKFNSFVPYDIGFQLSIYAKSQDDALQMVEQILPTFNPQYTLTIKPFTEYPDVKEDVPISLTSVDFQDDYESPLEQRRTIIYTLTFNMKVNFYGSITDSNVITKSINNLYDIQADSDRQAARITLTPTPGGILADSDYGFNQVIDELYPFDSA
jgi:hypothetical protein